MENRSRYAVGFTVTFLAIALLAIYAPINVMAQDISGPQITDLTSESPVTGGEFLISASVTDDSGVAQVRLYSLYFIVPGGITQPETVPMALNGAQYEALVSIPQNASKLTYTILASDTLSQTSITDVITWDVEDLQSPVAVCESLIYIDMNSSHEFNGSESTDNVEIVNYTWAISINGTGNAVLYGSAPVHIFTVPGDYSGRLSVYDSYGNSGHMNFQVRVNDTEPPAADAGIDMYVLSGQPQTLDGSGSSDNAGIVNYTWSFTYNETQVLLFGATPTFTFWTPGVYHLTLTVRDAAGFSGTSAISLEVLGDGSEEGSSDWWVYVLAAMIIAIVILAIVIIRL